MKMNLKLKKRTIIFSAIAVSGVALLSVSAVAVFHFNILGNTETPRIQVVERPVIDQPATPGIPGGAQREFLITPILSESEGNLYREAESGGTESQFTSSSDPDVHNHTREIEDFQARIDVELHSTLGGEDPLRVVMQEYFTRSMDLMNQPTPRSTEGVAGYLASVDCAIAVSILRETGSKLSWVMEVVGAVEGFIFSDSEKALVPPIAQRVVSIEMEDVIGYLHSSGGELPTMHVSDVSFLAKTAASCPTSYLKPGVIEVKAPADPVRVGVELNEKLLDTERCWTHRAEISEVLYGPPTSAFTLNRMREIEKAAHQDGCIVSEASNHD